MECRTVLVFLIACCAVDAATILGIFPYQGRSHNIMFEPLMVGLARAGHTVDVVSHFPPKESVPGLNHISLKGSLHFYVNNITVSFTKEMSGVHNLIHFISGQEPSDLCNLMRLPQLQNILNTKTKYDVMVTEVFGTNCYLAVAHKLQIPVVGVTTGFMYSWGYSPFFGDGNPSFIPSQLGSFTNEMSFLERVENTIVHLYSIFLFNYYERTISDPLARKYVEDIPPLTDLYNNMSLMLVNSHPSIHGVRPGNPAIVEVAGLHIDETQVLSKEIEEFLNSSKDGVVYFSMGTMLRSDTFSSDKISAIYHGFSELPNYNVLWKGNADHLPKPFPPNVKIVSWAPQYAVLRHPKVKAFITHGGLMGTEEAIHAGVPMIGIPFAADQTFNVAGYAHRGFAIHLDYKDLNKATFSKALSEVLTNPKYRTNAAYFSRLFKDRPLSPLDEAVFWIEYIVRNGGEPLKSSALHLYWFQYYLIDVILFLLTLTALVTIGLFLSIRKILCFVIGTTKTSTCQTKQKTK